MVHRRRRADLRTNGKNAIDETGLVQSVSRWSFTGRVAANCRSASVGCSPLQHQGLSENRVALDLQPLEGLKALTLLEAVFALDGDVHIEVAIFQDK
jgi:hypothetical protein